MRHPKTRIAALAMTVALAFSGCSLIKNASAPNDGAIVSAIQSKLYQDPVLKTRDIRVVSQQGVVVLSGTVDSDQEKASVDQIAHGADGVKQVIDQLAVNPQDQAAVQAPEAPAPPPAQPERRARRHHPRAAAEQESAPAAPAPVEEAAQAPAPVEQAPPAPEAPPPPPQPVVVQVPAGTAITVRTVDAINSETSQTGDEIAATVESQITENGQVVIPRYAKARLRLVNVRNAGHIKGQSEIQLQLVSVTTGGKTYHVSSGIYVQAANSRGKQTAQRAGVGAVVGGIIGAIAGGGRGAAIGAGVGAGAGTGVQVATKAQAVKIPSETMIDFTLRSPLNVRVNP